MAISERHIDAAGHGFAGPRGRAIRALVEGAEDETRAEGGKAPAGPIGAAATEAVGIGEVAAVIFRLER